jgi:hypothetical protein
MRLCLILSDGKVGANENRHEDGSRLSGDRGFLQQRVHKPPVPQRRPVRWSPVGYVLLRKD